MRDYLRVLESESIHILREVAATFAKPVLLYSVGKDSSVLLRLCQKAFFPGKIPFPLLHVDTGFKFHEMYEFRDRVVKDLNLELIVYRNEQAIAQNTNPHALGTQRCCQLLKTEALLQALRAGEFDAAIGGARRDEERSRAKERVYSFRDEHGQWDPKNQRPELWQVYNGQINPGESIRVFPLSNWTEADIWHYIYKEEIPIVPLYFAEKRKMVLRGSQIIPLEFGKFVLSEESFEEVTSRFRTLGCWPCTGAMRSNADSLEKILEEVLQISVSERSTRIIDYDTDGSMELKKREGYF